MRLVGGGGEGDLHRGVLGHAARAVLEDRHLHDDVFRRHLEQLVGRVVDACAGGVVVGLVRSLGEEDPLSLSNRCAWLESRPMHVRRVIDHLLLFGRPGRDLQQADNRGQRHEPM